MALATPVKAHWSQNLRFHVDQARHCADAGNFSYFHAIRAQHIATGIDHASTLLAQGIPQDDLKELNHINISAAISCEMAVKKLEVDVGFIKVDDQFPEHAKEAGWIKELRVKNDFAEKKIDEVITAGLSEAIDIISALPGRSRNAAAGFFIQGMNVTMEALEIMVDRNRALYDSVTEFIDKIWTALQNAWDEVNSKVSSCVKRLLELEEQPKANEVTIVHKDKASIEDLVGAVATRGKFTGDLIDISWPESYNTLVVELCTVRLEQEYSKTETPYSYYMSDREIRDGQWHRFFGVTDCDSPAWPLGSMYDVLLREQNRETRILGYEAISTPDEIDFEEVWHPQRVRASTYGEYASKEVDSGND